MSAAVLVADAPCPYVQRAAIVRGVGRALLGRESVRAAVAADHGRRLLDCIARRPSALALRARALTAPMA